MTVLPTRVLDSTTPESPEIRSSDVANETWVHASWIKIPSRLTTLAAARASAEEACRNLSSLRVRRAETTRHEATESIDQQRDSNSSELASLLASIRSKTNLEYNAEVQTAETGRATIRKSSEERYRRTQEKASTDFKTTRWESATMFETAEKGANDTRKEAQNRLAEETQSLDVLNAEAEEIAVRYRGFLGKAAGNSPEFEPIATPENDPFPSLRAAIEDADALVLKIEELRLPRAFQGVRIAWVVILPLFALAYPAWKYLGSTAGSIVAVVASLAIGFGLRHLIVAASRKSLLNLLAPLNQELARAKYLTETCAVHLKETHLRRMAEATERRDRELSHSQKLRIETLETAVATRDEKIREAESLAASRLNESNSRRDKQVQEANETQARRTQEIVDQHSKARADIEAKYQAAMNEAEVKRSAEWQNLAKAWSSGMAELTATIQTIRDEIDARFPDWNGYPGRLVPNDLPQAIRFGEIHLDLAKVAGGISEEEKLRELAPTSYRLPAIAAFPEHASIALEFSGEAGRKAAIEGMQAVMLRFLTGMPPGKVRLTLLDPVGLGRNFAGFMHLADYSEALVNNRIWTETQQIDARLSEINLHIETVIQNYLRNEFPTIESYNEQAAEVAEPYRILVVPDFPAGFNESIARRLLAIAKSGPRCGVYVVLGLDNSQPFPPNITREELIKPFVRISWKDGKFLFRNPEYAPFDFMVDTPPDPENTTRLLHKIGVAAREANRVEVPFEVIAPKPEDYWKGDSRSEVVVPLGRAGATKLQSLRLGRGTSQHVLIAGRTGSGKSTLLHALITNSALIYGPNELELYLIDFKKGVEFKTYATHALPHARVVAIESEREFGLSVLQRLDVELKRRGDIYRDLGVQDVAGFRAIAPDRPMPRILLVVDEFQEFFVEDDKVAQECSLLLDRLVRQGRAFGVHVHLGSQTLGGAYSLARSTLGQMAIRIALQCSEADAHLILNEENSAARLLSRPGEAIYNDANGQIEGNHVFQVVFLTDARREAYLKSLAELARERGIVTPPAIVFEGNKPSDLSNLAILNEPRKPKTGTVHAWLGEAVAIKDPTSAAFRSQGGNNLLILGQNEEMACGISTALLLGLAAQLPDESRILILDGTPEDSSSFGHLAKVANTLPISTRIGGIRDTASILEEASAEVERRQNGSGDSAPWFVMIQDLPRFRDLRKADDDYSFSSRRGGEEKAILSPAKMFSQVLREGPALGVHLIIWCDSVNNANRSFDRATMREFEMRVLFQMSPADSSNLIDSPLASRLGANRAFFSSEEEGRLEKFRPYGIPSKEWLEGRKLPTTES